MVDATGSNVTFDMSELTISQALRLSKKYKGQLSKLQERVSSSVTFATQGNKPAFSFSPSMEELLSTSQKLVELETRITLTNSATRIDWEGKLITLTQAIRTLNEWKSRISWLSTLQVKSQETTAEWANDYVNGQHVRVAVSFTCEFPEARKVAAIDEVQAKFDSLNDIVEKTNGSTPLVQA